VYLRHLLAFSLSKMYFLVLSALPKCVDHAKQSHCVSNLQALLKSSNHKVFELLSLHEILRTSQPRNLLHYAFTSISFNLWMSKKQPLQFPLKVKSTYFFFRFLMQYQDLWKKPNLQLSYSTLRIYIPNPTKVLRKSL